MPSRNDISNDQREAIVADHDCFKLISKQFELSFYRTIIPKRETVSAVANLPTFVVKEILRKTQKPFHQKCQSSWRTFSLFSVFLIVQSWILPFTMLTEACRAGDWAHLFKLYFILQFLQALFRHPLLGRLVGFVWKGCQNKTFSLLKDHNNIWINHKSSNHTKSA